VSIESKKSGKKKIGRKGINMINWTDPNGTKISPIFAS
jgi:hypothetical protein